VIPRGRSCSPWSDSWEAFPHGGAHPPAEVLMITSIENTGVGFAVLRKRRCWWCAWQCDDDVRVMQLVEGLDVRISCRETLGQAVSYEAAHSPDEVRDRARAHIENIDPSRTTNTSCHSTSGRF
jgi:hypothetical protein